MKLKIILKFNALINMIFEDFKDSKDFDAKFLYALKRNKEKLIPIINEFQQKILKYQQIKGLDEFETKRLELCEKYCKRNENNEPIIVDSEYQFEEDKFKEFEQEYQKLQEEYKDVIQKSIEFKKELNEYMEKDIEFSAYKIKIDYLPKNILSVQDINFLYDNELISE